MAKGLVSDTNLTAIANAIRTKNGSSDRYTPTTMAQAISDIPTSQVDQTTALQYMLNNKTDYTGIAAGLTTLTELPTFTQPAGVTNFDGAFSGCSSITASGISTLDMSSGDGFSNTFRGCTSLTSLPNGLDLASAMRSEGTFYGCTGLTGELNFGKGGGSSLTSRANMFYGCSGITRVTFASGAFGFSNMDFMFYNCSNLVELSAPNLSFAQTDVARSRTRTFSGCTKLTTVPNGIFSETVRSYSGMFADCISLRTLSSINLSGARILVSMFSGCTSLTSISLSSGTSTSSSTNFSYMFQGCSSLTSVPQLDTSKGTNFSYMFKNCSALTSVPQLDTSKGLNLVEMFRGCSSLTSVPQLSFASAVSNTYLRNIFNSCPALSNTSLDNIMASLLTATHVTSSKTLKYVGLSSAQATTCTGLSNWAALSAAGWTTGY